MNSINLKIIDWAKARGIFDKGTPLSQAYVTREEVDELIDGIHANDKAEIIDAIGDIYVTLIIQCAMQDVSLDYCAEYAYNQIKNRTGAMNDEGRFVKDE